MWARQRVSHPLGAELLLGPRGSGGPVWATACFLNPLDALWSLDPEERPGSSEGVLSATLLCADAPLLGQALKWVFVEQKCRLLEHDWAPGGREGDREADRTTLMLSQGFTQASSVGLLTVPAGLGVWGLCTEAGRSCLAKGNGCWEGHWPRGQPDRRLFQATEPQTPISWTH